MGRVRTEPCRGRGFVLGAAAIAAALIFFSCNSADARYHRYYVHSYRHAAVASQGNHHLHAEGYSPPTSSIVVDGNTGETLQASNVEALRHPASLTKIMTLYLLFERLEAGKVRLDTQLKVSEHAAEQAPTKLGLRPGQTIAVEDAIKAVVTKSANDAAVAIAENLGGDEDSFARLMTEKAHALGMSRTTYVNASGLPNDEQNTTAQDQALLGRAIQERFPRYYKYFSTEQFVYHGHAMRNHNHLLGVVGGVDGIKTGYTRASGFNLVTSVHRDGHYIIAVVLGGRSSYERDSRMRELINTHIREASLRHTAPAIAERIEPQRNDARPAADKSDQRAEQKVAAVIKTPPAARVDAAPTNTKPNGNATVGTTDPIQPVAVKTITYRTAPLQAAPLAPMPALVPSGGSPPPLPTPPAVSAARGAAPQGAPAAEAPSAVVIAAAEPAAVATVAKAETVKAETIKGQTVKGQTVKTDTVKTDTVKADAVRAALAKPDTPKVDSVKSELPTPAPSAAQIRAWGGWLIQIGAYEGEGEAKQRLSEARLKVPTLLSTADPFTERVQKGDKALYRARFAGFGRAAAETACRQLKRSDINCITVKN
jgi:D-alanyl-D-alanine carboxypeptidase